MLPPGANAVTTALIHNPDVGTMPVFAATGGYALPTVPVTGPALLVTPREQIAPLGSEVVLIASRLGNADRLITNEKIEWALEGVGTIEKFDAGSCCDLFFFDCVKAKKVTDRYVITKTSSVYQTLDRGTPDTTDDVHLLRGQTWISVNSMKEGTTHVTAFAPNMTDWSRRTDAGIIHWVDAQWMLPRLAIAPIGESRVLTTTVLRSTNGQPRQGWIVRYEILNGPAAGLGGSGAQVEEVETDFAGQATIILTPREQRAGTNTIRIQIIRPAGLDGDHRITVGSETVRQTWAGNPNILLKIEGPREARPSQDLPYEITAENRSSLPVQGTIALPIPPLASYIRSEPAGLLQGSTVQWHVNLPPNSTTKIDVVLRQGTLGPLWLHPEFRRTGGGVVSTVPSPSPPASPSRPGSSATVYPGAQTPPPVPSGLLPDHPPPTPTLVSPSLSIQIKPTRTLVAGDKFRFFISIMNTGTSDVQNVSVAIPLPPSVSGDEVGGETWSLTAAGEEPTFQTQQSDWHIGFVGSRQIGLLVPTLPAGRTAHFALDYPSIGQQGYDVTYTIYVDGQFITQGTEWIIP
jgi:uncharacterized repeat protein (TIGR01451 family)